MTPHPEGQPAQQQGWFGRNWKWLVPAGCLVPMLCCGVFGAATYFAATKMIQSSGAYVAAIAQASESDEVRAAFGGQVAPSGFLQGEVKESNGEGTADFQVPLEGPKGKGTLFVTGTGSNGQWRFSRLEVQTPGGQRLDLQARGARGAPPADELPPEDALPVEPEPADPPEE